MQFNLYVACCNALGALIGSIVLTVIWLDSRKIERLLVAENRPSESCPTRQRIALELLAVSFLIAWSLGWAFAVSTSSDRGVVLPPTADAANSALRLAAGLVLLMRSSSVVSAPSDRIAMWLAGIFGAKAKANDERRWSRVVRRFPYLAAAGGALLSIHVAQHFVGFDRHWHLFLSACANFALLIGIWKQPGSNTWRVAVLLVIGLQAALQVPAHNPVESTELIRRVCLLGLAALKPLQAWICGWAIAQEPVSYELAGNRHTLSHTWHHRVRTRDRFMVIGTIAFAFAVLVWAPLDSTRPFSTAERIFVSAVLVAATAWVTFSIETPHARDP